MEAGACCAIALEHKRSALRKTKYPHSEKRIAGIDKSSIYIPCFVSLRCASKLLGFQRGFFRRCADEHALHVSQFWKAVARAERHLPDIRCLPVDGHNGEAFRPVRRGAFFDDDEAGVALNKTERPGPCC